VRYFGGTGEAVQPGNGDERLKMPEIQIETIHSKQLSILEMGGYCYE